MLTPALFPHPTLQLTIGRGEVNTGLGGSKQEELDIEVRMQITYLDDNLRVTRFLVGAAVCSIGSAALQLRVHVCIRAVYADVGMHGDFMRHVGMR